jgi:hypothetical protein
MWILIFRNFGISSLGCNNTLYSFYGVPHSKCVADSTENIYKSSRYTCVGTIVYRQMHVNLDCSDAGSKRDFPETRCASLPIGDYFSQFCS